MAEPVNVRDESISIDRHDGVWIVTVSGKPMKEFTDIKEAIKWVDSLLEGHYD